MKFSRSSALILGAWVFFVGGYTAASLLLPHGHGLVTFSDLMECCVPLFANTCLLWNAASPYRRRNAFWMLLALGCTLWLAGALIWTYEELVLHNVTHIPFPGDLLMFLHVVPLLAALTMVPHARKMREVLRFGFVDLTLLSLLTLYAYVFIVIPWKTVWPNEALFRARDLNTYVGENLLVVLGFGILALRARGGWRVIYANLCGAMALYAGGFLLAHYLISNGQEPPGTLLALPILGTFVWLGTTGILAGRQKLDPEPVSPQSSARRAMACTRGHAGRSFAGGRDGVVCIGEHGSRACAPFPADCFVDYLVCGDFAGFLPAAPGVSGADQARSQIVGFAR